MNCSVSGSGLIPLGRAIAEARAVGTARNERVCVVGGVVRDLLMGRAVGDYDLDLVVEGSAREFAGDLQRVVGGELKEHGSFLTCKLSAPFQCGDQERVFKSDAGPPDAPSGVVLSEIDIVTARTEVYPQPGALPQVVAARLEEDLARRDFSCNAMALSLAAYERCVGEPPGSVDGARLADYSAQHHFLDPFNGVADLRTGVVRILHAGSFIDDPTRLFRAVRYACRLGFSLETSTEEEFARAVSHGALRTISVRRVWNEVVTTLDEEDAVGTLSEMLGRGLFAHFPLVDATLLGALEEPLKRIAANRVGERAEDVISARKMVFLGLGLQARKEPLIVQLQESRSLVRGARALLDSGGSVGAVQVAGVSPAQLLAHKALR